MEKELRFLTTTELRVAKADDKPTTIRGYAAVFNEFSEDFGGWKERILPGAFAKAIKNDDVRALVDHDSSRIIGRNKAGTLRMTEDKRGLLVEIDPPDTQIGRDVITSIERGDVTGMSFGFRTMSDQWVTDDGMDVRELKEVKLFDVSPVTFPAYPDTSVAVRSMEEHKKEEEPDVDNGLMEMQLKLAEAE